MIQSIKKTRVLGFFLVLLMTAGNHKNDDKQTGTNTPVELAKAEKSQNLIKIKTPKTPTEVRSPKPPAQIQTTKTPYEILREITLPYKMATLPDKKAMADYVAGYDKNPIKGDIIIFFVDTLRYDMALKYAPTVKEFMSQTLSGEHIASGTCTFIALYSMFHSQPAILAYKDYLSIAYDETERGSFFFQLLKQQGYNIYGIGFNFVCWTPELNQSFKYIYTENISFFGHNTHLLSNCSEERYAGYPATYDTSQRDKVNEDQLKIERFKKIYEKNQAEGQAGVYIIEQYGVHDTYTWLKNLDNLPYPSADHLNKYINCKNFTDFTEEEIYRSFANAVYSMDTQFKEVIDYLKKRKSYENTTLVFLSDHGESLGEKKPSAFTRPHQYERVYFHGRSINNEEISTLYAIKFNHQANVNYKVLQHQKISSIDFLPTLFDGLRYELDDAKEFYKGGSVIKNNHGSEYVSILPNWTEPTRRFSLTNDKYKAHLLIDADDFYEANKFKIIGIHTLDDKPLEDTQEKEMVINNIETLFSKAINHIFPSD